MPFSSNGTYTPASGATTAAPGQIIKSSVWNAVFTDISSALTTLGQQLYNSTSVSTTPYVPASTDTLLLVNTGSAITVNLPSAASRNGYPLKIKDSTGTANTNNVTINRNGTDTIEGLTSITINLAYGGYNLIPVTGGWIISP